MNLIKSVSLVKRQSEKNMQRFYKIMLTRDLFGFYCVIREWGRIGSAGQVKQDAFASSEDAVKLFERKKREKLGKRKQYRIEGAFAEEEAGDRCQGGLEGI